MKDDSLNDQVDSEELPLRINQFKEPNPNSVGMVDMLGRKLGLAIADRLLENVYELEIWNKAIEAEALIVDKANRDGPYNAIVSAREIRKLKK